MGAVGFCDDILLLAPTRDGIKLMLDTCQLFAAMYNLKLSTDPNPEKSKTKCIFVCGKSRARDRVWGGQDGHQDNHREELEHDEEGDWAEHRGVQNWSSPRAASQAGNNCSRRRQVEDDVLG